VMNWTGHVAHIKVITNLYKMVLRNPERQRPIKRSRYEQKEKRCENVHCTQVAQDGVADSVLNLRAT
jgi:hypothetical protein